MLHRQAGLRMPSSATLTGHRHSADRGREVGTGQAVVWPVMEVACTTHTHSSYAMAYCREPGTRSLAGCPRGREVGGQWVIPSPPGTPDLPRTRLPSFAVQRTVCPSVPNTEWVRKRGAMLSVRDNIRPLPSPSSWSHVPLCGHGFHLWSTHWAGAQRGHPCLLPFAVVDDCEHVLCRAHLIQLTVGIDVTPLGCARRGSVPRRR